MKLSRGDQTIGISFDAAGKSKPISLTFATPQDQPDELETMFFRGWYLRDDDRRKKEEERQKEVYSRPRPYQPEITVGLGLDRESAKLSRDDFEALIQVVDRIRDDIKARDVEVERYERKRKEERAKT